MPEGPTKEHSGRGDVRDDSRNGSMSCRLANVPNSSLRALCLSGMHRSRGGADGRCRNRTAAANWRLQEGRTAARSAPSAHRKRMPVDCDDEEHVSERLPTEIAAQECQVPAPEAVGIVGIEIRITCCPHMAVMIEMGATHLAPAKPRVKEQQARSDRAVEPRPSRGERSVHRIMADNENANGQPAIALLP